MVTYIVCIICELAWIFCYGLLLNSFLPMSVFFFAAFGIPFCVKSFEIFGDAKPKSSVAIDNIILSQILTYVNNNILLTASNR